MADEMAPTEGHLERSLNSHEKEYAASSQTQQSSNSKQHDHHLAAVSEEDREKENALGTEPQFSLAGPNTTMRSAFPSQNLYEDPEYRDLNPQYGKSQDEPLWSLAQPLPRVVRPGMDLGHSREGKEEIATETVPASEAESGVEAEKDEKGEPQTSEDNFFNFWGRIRNYFREGLAEWLGTTIAILIGLCSTLSRITSQEQAGTFESQSWSWGFGFMLAIYITGGISGGHLNPAISISLSVFRGFPARRCAEYILAQILGALTAGGVAYGLYRDSILHAASVSQVSREEVSSSALFTMSMPWVHPVTGFFTEFAGTAVIVCTILALGDHTNSPPGAGMQAFIVGLLIAILCMSLGYNTGGCFNPARDFGPRLIALMAGYGGKIFTQQHAWWVWGPWVADITGGLCGAVFYDSMIFTGGESPINYPLQMRKRAYLIRLLKLRNWLRWKKPQDTDIEAEVRDVEAQ